MPNRGGSRSRNNNPSGRNQYSGSGVTDLVRERPIAAAAVAAGAAAAGLFLWSRRSQISEQLGNLSDQIGEWTENMSSSMSDKFSGSGQSNSTDDTAGLTTSSSRNTNRGRSSSSNSSTGSGRSQSTTAEA